VNPVWAVHLEHVRRRWALVVLLAVVAGVVSAAALLIAGPSYTGRAALAIVSQNRSPDQDAVLGRGYVDLFNQPSLQAEYARRDALAPDVAFSARLAAGTPVIYVEATSPDADVAGRAATALAVTLRDDVNTNLTPDRVAAATDLTNRLKAAQARLATLSPTSPDRGNVANDISSLQNQLGTVQANSTNQLRDLQLDAGVTENAPPMTRTVTLAVLGGALVGLLAAALLGAAEPGLRSATQIRARLGLDILARLDRTGSAADTDRELARVLSHPGLGRPGTLALASVGSGDDAEAAGRDRGWVSAALARLAVRQGDLALLLRADVAGDPRDDELGRRPGVADVLARHGGAPLDGFVHRDAQGLLAVGPGSRRDDLYTLFSRERTPTLVAAARTNADLVVIDAPAVVEPGDAGAVVCSVAPGTVLVLTGATRAADARVALDALTRAGARVLGVVTVAGDSSAAGAGPDPFRVAPVELPDADTTVETPSAPVPEQSLERPGARPPAHAMLQVRPATSPPTP
jgi:polysaccharide biosynthesis transport protein